MKLKAGMIITSVIAAAALSACSNNPKQADTNAVSNTSQAAAEVGGSYYAVVSFDKGQEQLTRAEKQKIRALAQEASKRGTIAEYKIMAWADKEYPTQGQSVLTKDARLADKRADGIKEYLEKDLKVDKDIENHNMAKRPGVFAEMVKSDDFELKTTFEQTGAAPVAKAPVDTLTDSKVSKAVILVRYE